jgi:hypothetical protein
MDTFLAWAAVTAIAVVVAWAIGKAIAALTGWP